MNNIGSHTYEIKKNKNIKFIVLPIILIVVILIAILFLINRNSPKSTVKSFFDALQNYDNDKVISFIDFDKMVMLKSTSNDFNNLSKNIENIPHMTDDEQSNFIESIAYTKRYINSIVNEFKNSNAILTINNIETSKIEQNDDICKVIVDVTIKKDKDTKTDVITFYTQKVEKTYRIIAIYGEIYF